MATEFPKRCFCMFLLAVVLLLAPRDSWAWGCKGHQTVALLAEAQLSPEVRDYVLQLLRDNPIDSQLKRYCGGFVADPMADASTWADDIRKQANNGPWHYIDIPRGAPRQPLEAFCGSGSCITREIEEEEKVLRDPNAPAEKKTVALRYLIHFVGDLHMPLHATTNNDEGGNCVPLKYFWRAPHEHNHSYSPNLHSLWDTAIPERDMAGADPSEYAVYLDQQFRAKYATWRQQGVHPDDWAWESHDLAESMIYQALDTKIPRETPSTVHTCSDANDVGARMAALQLSAGESYQQLVARTVEEQIAKAGTRLAMILNETLAHDGPPQHP